VTHWMLSCLDDPRSVHGTSSVCNRCLLSVAVISLYSNIASLKHTSARPKSTRTPLRRLISYKKLLVELECDSGLELEDERRLDISMQDTLLVDCYKCCKQRSKVYAHIRNCEISKVFLRKSALNQDSKRAVYSKVYMAKVRQKSCDKGTDRITASESIEQLEFILDPHGTTRDIYLLDCNILRSSLLLVVLCLLDSSLSRVSGSTFLQGWG
jgi:hypothetical protein